MFRFLGLSPRLRISLWLLMAAFFLVSIRVNFNRNYYGELHHGQDENLTYTQAMNSIFGLPTTSYRAQEGVRWLIKASVPLALYRMTIRMGGSVAGDQWMSGLDYLQKNGFSDFRDPNIREFIFSLRLPAILMFFASFIPLIVYLDRNKRFLTLSMLIVLMGTSPDVIFEQKFFYIEPSLIACINLLLAAFLFFRDKESVSLRATIMLAFLSAFTFAVKASGLFFIFLPVYVIVRIHKGEALWTRLFLWGSLTAVFYVLINYPLLGPDRMVFLNDFFGNFWHYAQSGVSPSGMNHLVLTIPQLCNLFGFLAYCWPGVILLGMVAARSRDRETIALCTLLVMLTVVSAAKFSIFWQRNFIVVYTPLLVAVGLALEAFLEKLCPWVLKVRRPIWIALPVVSLLFLVMPFYWYRKTSIQLHDLPATNAFQIWPDCRKNLLSALEQAVANRPAAHVFAIGFDSNFFKGLKNRSQIAIVPDFPLVYPDEDYRIIADRYIHEVVDQHKNSIVLVNRIAKNFQLTNWVLWRHFAQNRQWCDYFLLADTK